MARCNCGGSSCQCLVLAGDGTDVAGSGSVNDPYIISNTALAGSFLVRDTATVDLSVNGAGRPADPYILSADATVPLTGLFDRDSADTAPQPGFVPAWQSNGKWRFVAPPVAPAGATNTSGGIGGTGTVADPVVARTSGTWGTAPLTGADSTAGQQIYVDVNGQLRAAPLTSLRVPWDNIDGKPSVFPSNWASVAGKPTSFDTSWNQVAGRPLCFQTRVNMGSTLPAGTQNSAVVTFPAGYFSEVPFIQVTVSRQVNDVGQGAWFTCAVGANPTTGSCVVIARNISSRSDVGCELTVTAMSGTQW